MKCCETCGQTLPEPLPHNLKFRGIKAQILHFVHRSGVHGIRSDILFDLIYGADPNGGPDTGQKILAVHICRMNKDMKIFGLRLRSLTVGRGGYGSYVLIKKP